MSGWRFRDTVRLVFAAYGWLVGVTVPAVTLSIGVVDAVLSAVRYGSPLLSEAVWGTLLTMLLVDVAAAVVAIGGAVFALPFTHVLGRRLSGVRSRAVHVSATAVLAGVLGAVTGWWSGEWWWPSSGPPVAAVIGVAATGAGAIARWRQLRASTARTVETMPTVDVTS